MNLPQDPYILFSYLNTQLRDNYSSFVEFCEDKDVDPMLLLEKLRNSGFEYDSQQNRFS